MGIVNANSSTVVLVEDGKALTIVADAFASGMIYQLKENQNIAADAAQTVVAGSTVVLGPYAGTKRIKIVMSAGSLTTSVGAADSVAPKLAAVDFSTLDIATNGTYVHPLKDIGENFVRDGIPYRKITVPGSKTFRYALAAPQRFTPDPESDNKATTTTRTLLGTITLPAGVMTKSEFAEFSFSIVSQMTMPNAEIYFEWGDPTAGFHRTATSVKSIVATGTMAAVIGSTGITLSVAGGGVSADGNSATKDMNLLAPIEIKIYGAYVTTALPGGYIQLGDCYVDIKPRICTKKAGRAYRDVTVQPYAKDDVYNTPLGAGAILRVPLTFTGATGTQGATTIAVTSAVGATKGSFVTGTGVGANAIVQSISGNTLTVDVANSSTVSGSVVLTPIETALIRLVATVPSPATGLGNPQSTRAFPWAGHACALYRLTGNEPFADWQVDNHLWMGAWPFANPAGNTFRMQTPIGIQAGLGGGDSNVVFISADGRYAFECIGYSYSNGVHHAGNSAVVDLLDGSYQNITNRTWDVNRVYGITLSTRGGGTTLLGGVVRKEELDLCVDQASALTAIKHPIAMVLDMSQMKSLTYQNGASASPLLSYPSDSTFFNKAIIAAAGTGYAVGDVLYLDGGTFITPMRLIVQEVTAAGGVVVAHVSNTGMYKVAPTGTLTAMTCSTSGAGTGCTLNFTNANGGVTTLATAFPTATKAGQRTWPASAVDWSSDTTYTGAIPMGALFAIPSSVDLTTLGFTSLEGLAVASAIQKYGAYAVDIGGSTHTVCLVTQEVSDAQLLRLTGDPQNDSYDFVNMRLIKGQLAYVENNSPTTIGGPGARIAAIPLAPPPLF